MTDHPEKRDPFAALEAAARLLEQAGDKVAASTMDAVGGARRA